jgi:putative transposase
MPRAGRLVLPNYPHHIVQRGHNRRIVFSKESDFEFFLATLRECKSAYGVKVYAFCLMPNHIHLVLEPSEEVEMLGKFMKRLAGRQTRYANRLHGRTGTLWESRYKSSAIQEKYLLACCRYVELNPVRACVAAGPEGYRWSSYRCRIGESDDSLVDPIPSYGARDSREIRCRRYKEFVAGAIPEGEWQLIRQAVQRCQLTGDSGFISEVEKIVGRRIELRGRGRPRRTTLEGLESSLVYTAGWKRQG